MKGFDDIIITEVDDSGGVKKEAEERKPTGGKKPHMGSKSVHVAFVMDHSGSMTGQRKLALDNYNEQIATLKQNSGEIDTYVTLIEFDNRIIVEHTNVPLDDIEPGKDYWTNGSTSLNDAIFTAINQLEKDMKNDPTEDKSALVIIMTDGFENSSVEFRGNKGKELVKAEIQKLEKTDEWTFTFMGADIDVQSVAVEGYGMSIGNTIAFNKNSRGFKMSGGSAKSGVAAYYTARTVGETSVKNFHDHNTTTTGKSEPVTSSTAKEAKEE